MNGKTRTNEMLQMRLDGATYAIISKQFNISRQRVQTLISPPKQIREQVVRAYKGKCSDCGITVGKSGHVHHLTLEDQNYNDTTNLTLLCGSCHRKAHKESPSGADKISVRIKPEVLAALEKLKHPGQTISGVIQELLDKVKEGEKK